MYEVLTLTFVLNNKRHSMNKEKINKK